MKHPFDLLYNAALRAGDLPAVKSRRTRRTGGRTNYKCARRPNGTCVSGVLPGSALLRYIAFQHCALCDGCVVALRLTHVSTPVTVTDWSQLQATEHLRRLPKVDRNQFQHREQERCKIQ